MTPIQNYISRAFAATMLCVALASCTQDAPVSETDDSLPEGSHPLAFVTSVNGHISRAEGKSECVDGDEIGVRISNTAGVKYPIVGRY